MTIESEEKTAVSIKNPVKLHEALDRYTTGSSMHGYEGTMHAGQSYQTEVLDPFLDYLKVKFDNMVTVLDVASGKGEAADYVERGGVHTVRLDLSEVALQMATGNRVRAMATQLPIQTHSVQGIHMKDALVHIENREALLTEFSRVLKVGGVAVIVSYDAVPLPSFSYKEDDIEHHCSPSSSTEYLGIVAHLLKRPNISNIGPLYFPTPDLDVIDEAALVNLELIAYGQWTTKDGEEDWYKGEHVPRSVIIFEKYAA